MSSIANRRDNLLGKVPDTHSVGAICNHDLGVFTVPKLAMVNANAVANGPGPQDVKGGLSGVAQVRPAECGVGLPCAAGRLAIAVHRTC
jgi:hypothetical protein